jgi:hypothetical protein
MLGKGCGKKIKGEVTPEVREKVQELLSRAELVERSGKVIVFMDGKKVGKLKLLVPVDELEVESVWKSPFGTKVELSWGEVRRQFAAEGRSMKDEAKRLLKFEFLSQGALGGAEGLAEAFFEVIITRMGASPFMIGLLGSSAYVSNLFSPYGPRLPGKLVQKCS